MKQEVFKGKQEVDDQEQFVQFLEENIDKVSTAILSQDHKPGTHETPNQITRYTGMCILRFFNMRLRFEMFQQFALHWHEKYRYFFTIWLGVSGVPGLTSWVNIAVDTLSIFSSVRTVLGRSLPAFL